MRIKKHDVVWWMIPGGTVLLVAVFMIFRWTSFYVVNDDWGIRSIISGAYLGQPSGQAVFFAYPLSFFLSKLYSLRTDIPWYAFFNTIVLLYCFLIVCISVKKIFKGKIALALTIFISVCFFSASIYYLIYMQFTLIATIASATAVYLYTTNKASNMKIYHLILCICLGYMIRKNVLLMCIPFFGMIWLIEIIYAIKRKEKSGHLFKIPILCGILLLLIEGVDFVAYNLQSNEWGEYKEHQMDYVIPVDYYGWPDYDENIDLFNQIEMSEADYGLMTNKHILSLNNGLTPEKMGCIAERSQFLWEEKNSAFKRLTDAIEVMLHTKLNHNMNAMISMILGMYVGIFLYALIYKNVKCIWQILGLIFARCFAWLFLLFQGRFPSRIGEALFIIEFFALLAILLSCIQQFVNHDLERKSINPVCGIKKYTICLLGLFLFFLTLSVTVEVVTEVEGKQNYFQSQVGDWDLLNEYCFNHSENFYVLGTGTLKYYTEKVYYDVNENYQNYIVFGTWQGRLPLEKEKLKRQGIENLERDLFEKDNIYLIYEEGALQLSQYILDYFEQKYPEFHYERIDIFQTKNTAYEVFKLSYTKDKRNREE